ncbi:response regulator [Mucilaginibacter celer]|uniref:Response regulator n=1 Tax=Mucilaginibacter celer TaxID=2305508 RepID=A0A494VKM9_9SPHI|nr:response regulator [Mucilaginibacter celer]AYL94011.1 response regulator [Mucilaginibacter celer]
MIEEENPVSTWIVDDDPIYVYGIRKLMSIRGANAQVSHFPNGLEAINQLKNLSESHQTPDMILLDINMPTMDGWEFMNEFAEIKPRLGKEITIYLVSSSVDLNDINRAKSIPGITDYIFKPVKGTHLTEIFASAQQKVNERIKKYGT